MDEIPKARTYIWRSFAELAKDVQIAFDELGDIIQLRGFFLRVYCLRDPSQIEQVLRDPQVGVTKLPSVFPRLKWLMSSSTVVVSGGRDWHRCQDVMKTMFGTEYMRRYSLVTTELIRSTLDERWKEFATDRRTFDIYEETQFLLTRLAARLLFSVELPQDQAADMSRKCSFLEYEFSKRLPPILPTSSDRSFRRYTHELRSWMRSLLRQRQASSLRQLDLLQILSDRADSLSEDWIIDHMIEMWNSVRLVNPPVGLAFRLVAEHVEVQSKLRRELSQAALGTSPGFDETRSLAYVNMVLSETLRFYPSIMLLPRWCANGMKIDGHNIPPRSLVVPMIYHTHRNPKCFPNPMEFDPERWGSDRQQAIHSHARLAFGAGQRGCLGVKMAKDIMRTLLTAVFQRYHLEQVPKSRSATDVELCIHPSQPVWMRLKAARVRLGEREQGSPATCRST